MQEPFFSWPITHHLPRFAPWLKRGKKNFPQVLLITGFPGTGKEEVAEFFSQWLLCTQDQNFPCLKCIECQNISLSCSMHVQKLDPDSQTQPLKIETFRTLQSQLHLSLLKTKPQMIFIPKVERMTLPAISCMPKT